MAQEQVPEQPVAGRRHDSREQILQAALDRSEWEVHELRQLVSVLQLIVSGARSQGSIDPSVAGSIDHAINQHRVRMGVRLGAHPRRLSGGAEGPSPRGSAGHTTGRPT